MDFVFIDTSIIKKEQYFKEGNKIQTLKELAQKNMIWLVTTEITINEIKQNLYADILGELNKFSKGQALLSHLGEWSNPDVTDLKEKVDKIIDDFFEGENVSVLGYEYCGSVKEVFSRYFENQPPFGAGKKKSEFPDAFILSALENFSRQNDDCEDNEEYRYVVLSLDNDMRNYVSERLYIPDVDEYLDTIFTAGQNVEAYIDAVYHQDGDINKILDSQIRNALLDSGLYYRALGKINVVDFELEGCHSILTHDRSFVTNNNDSKIEFEMTSFVKIKGKLYFSMESDGLKDFILEENVDMESFMLTVVCLEKKTMKVSKVYGYEPDLYDAINKSLLNSKHL